MPPAAPDDLIRQHSRPLEENPPSLGSGQTPIIPEHESSGGKSKKKKSGKKAKGAKATTETPEDLYDLNEQWHAHPTGNHFSGALLLSRSPLDHHVQPTVTSPVLDALQSIGGSADHDLTARTDTWAQNVPYGKSPPTDLIDDLPSESPLNFPAIPERGGFSQPSSASPPTRIRPFSYGSGYRSSMQSRQQSVDPRKSHSYGSPMSNLAPPPHLPQAHFYGAPDIDLPGQSRSATQGASSFCGFDTLPGLSTKTPRAGMNVVVVGSDGAVDILALEDRRTRLVGQVTGLNGRVLEAKILPGPSSNDPLASSQPHIAVILHGPQPPNDDEGQVSATASEANEVPPRWCGVIQVYALRSGDLIATLFASKPVPALENIPGLPSLAPAPVGSLKLYNTGIHVIVASGISGEVYVFRQIVSGAYQCLGKTWTNVQPGEVRRYSTSSSSTDPDGSRHESPRVTLSERPILSVQGRWLAIMPPSSSVHGSIHGAVPVGLVHSRAHGMETRSPSTVPSVNCATDVGEGESFFNKFARGVTQELVKGARFLGDQGLQAWNNYWNNQPPSPGTHPRPIRGPDSPTQGYATVFPPTHAQETQTSAPEPDAISIIDLKRFEDGMDSRAASLNPVATFQVPNGCSFLSLSPNGLMLFTASKKGDVQYVWDLMQLRHCRAMAFISDDYGGQTPNVRQVARYTRLTTSSIIDVIWTALVGDRLAVITRKGTIHAFDLPRSAFQWPPFRRARPAPKRSSAVDLASDELSRQATQGNPLSAAMNFVGGKTQPFISAVRGRVPSSGAAFPNMSGFGISTAAGIKGSKVVAAGLSKSMGAAASGTVESLRHVGENRLHLPGLARDPAPNHVVWIHNKGHIFLGIVDEGQFKLYRLKRSTSTHKSRQSHSVIGAKEIQFKLPSNMQNTCGPAPLLAYDPEKVVQASLVLPSTSSQPSYPNKFFHQPLSQAEIETNTPYQPFHTDQRVGLHVYPADNTAGDIPSGQWLFGEDIPTTKVHVRSYNNSGDDREGDEDEDAAIHAHSFGAGGDMENLITLGNSTGNVEEVVITTRRKKKHSATPLKAEDGFFEDDCEVLDFARDRV
ncbi:hypothetical protein N7462_002961 [Penicillium macrosclerotiorum]|uniref:uncharacterized protein n=1 Tax=Penicillium macrosclerotiorum TaxID=303699 RepID=UPI002548A0CC|nr:uncharacterized protein N7462_002961 [Penicillium macrosclerotiorum]KAJ5688569.1 hypothetical protein N7462_002961 [Penicillium macrosclerotiorum]